MSKKEVYDITIIGGGPTGMFAAFYAGIRNAKVKIIDALPMLGGQVSLLYPEKTIYDVAGFPGITGEKFIAQLHQQMAYFDQTICLNEKVEQVERVDEELFQLTTTKAVHYSKTVIVAAGAGAFEPRKLPLESAKQYEEKTLDYMVTDKRKYDNAVVAICGGGDTAVDWALELEKTAKKVYLIHRRPVFRAHEYAVELLKQSSVEILTPFTPLELHGSDGALTKVTLQEVRKENQVDLPVDYLIVNYGFSSSIGTFQQWGLETTKNELLVNPKMETNLKGIYAAGDIAGYDGKIKLIATGFGDAPTAVNHAIHYLNPTERTQPIQSTELQLDASKKE